MTDATHEAAASSQTNNPPTCHGGLANLDEEFEYWIDDVEGQVPANLSGTFFRNGPGRQRIGETRYGHWFDGDGMVCAFTFANGRVHFRNRYVRTPKYVDETEAQAVRYRGFGTQLPGGLRANFLKLPANPANTNTVYHGEHLLALNEGGKPWALDPATLQTLGEFDYAGGLARNDVFSAHGKIHPETGDYFNFGAGISGVSWRGVKACLNLYRIAPSGRLERRSQLPLTAFPFCHDFALTRKHAVFFINSIVFGGMGRMLLGMNTIADQMHFDASMPMQIIVVDLDTLNVVSRIETDPGAIIHFANAFDDGDRIIVDGMYAEGFEASDTLQDVFNTENRFNGGAYVRFTLNTRSGQVTREPVVSHESEFPTINPALTGARHPVCYTACSIPNGANSFFNAIQRVTFEGDSTLVTLPPGTYGSEPLFAPATDARGPEDGYLLEVVYDGYRHRSELQIYRADDIRNRVATLRLKHHVPHQFHGFFTERVFVH